jgi:hypothetical protein
MVFVDKLRRSTSLAAAALLLVASAVPLLATRTASAYELLGEREIRMESSAVDADGLNYRVEFDLTGTQSIEAIVVSFCEDSPIIGEEDCLVPTGFEVASTAFTGDDGTEGDVDVSGFTPSTSRVASGGDTGDNTFTITGSAASATGTVVFTLEDVTNPSDLGTFYARIMVYDDDTRAAAYSNPNDPENPDQAGGIALSTAEVITIEAKVQERLTFCLFTDALDPDLETGNINTCDGVTTEDVLLGDDNGVLDSTMPSINKDAKFNITTNASAGAIVRMSGSTLTSGSFQIDSIGDTPTEYEDGTEQFGLCVYTDPLGLNTAGLVPTGDYSGGAADECELTDPGQAPDNDNGALFTFHSDALDPEVTYGSAIAEKAAGEFSTGRLVFLGGVSDTTEPGIYTTTLNFVATGRY